MIRRGLPGLRSALPALAPALLASAGWAAPQPDSSARILDLLEHHRRGELERPELQIKLDGLGPAALDGVFGLLSGTALARPGEAAETLSPQEEELLLEALRAWPIAAVVAGVRAQLTRESTLGERLLAVRLLGETRDIEAAGAVVEVLTKLEPEQLQSRLVADSAQRAWSGLLSAGGARALATLKVLVSKLDPLLLPGVVQALGELQSGAIVPLLARLEGDDPALDALILDALGNVPVWDDFVLDGTVPRMVRAHLASDQAESRRRAALALANLRDAQAFPELVALLDDDDSRVRRAAQAALKSISGLRRSEEAERWLSWYDKEAAWRGRSAPEALARVQDGAPPAAVQALRDLSAHPFYRESLAEELGTVLARRDEEAVLVAVCGTLARLRGGSAVASLVNLLEDERPAVQAAALSALRSTTGASFDADVEAWHTLVGGWSARSR